MNSIQLKETNKNNTFFILKEKIKQKHKNIESQIESKEGEREIDVEEEWFLGVGNLNSVLLLRLSGCSWLNLKNMKERAMQAIIENRKLHYQLQTHQSMLIIQKKRSQT